MITGVMLIIVGLFAGFFGTTKFNFFIMGGGWALAAVGVIVFLNSFVHLP